MMRWRRGRSSRQPRRIWQPIALHAFPPKDVDDEFFIRGYAEATDPTAELKAAIISAAAPATVGAEEEQLFQLYLDRVLIATDAYRGQWPPVYERWAATDAHRR
jgi:hypothetical protein